MLINNLTMKNTESKSLAGTSTGSEDNHTPHDARGLK